MSKIILYHGTIADFDTIDLKFAKYRKDFGRGFYMTTSSKQAQDWALKYKNIAISRGNYTKGYVYSIKIDDEFLNKLDVKEFKGADINWINYIINNRTKGKLVDGYDLVIGKVADASAQRLIDDYEYNSSHSDEDKLKLIKDLQVQNLVDQYCFKTNKSIILLNRLEMRRKEI